MHSEIFSVQNVKCGGCAANIKSGLESLNGISAVTVEIESGSVTVSGTNIERDAILSKLSELGYPVND